MDREVVLAAVEQDGDAIRHAAEIMREDSGVVLTAMARNNHTLYSAAPVLLETNKTFVLEALKLTQGRALALAGPALQADREVVLAAVAQDGRVLEAAAPQLRADREIVLAAITQAQAAVAAEIDAADKGSGKGKR